MSKKSNMMQLFTGCMNVGMTTNVVLKKIEAFQEKVSKTTNRAMTAFRELFGNKTMGRVAFSVIMLLMLVFPAAAEDAATVLVNGVKPLLDPIIAFLAIITPIVAVLILVGHGWNNLVNGGTSKEPLKSKASDIFGDVLWLEAIYFLFWVIVKVIIILSGRSSPV